MSDKPPAFSRAIPSALIGTYDDQLPAIRVHSETKRILDRLAHEAGLPLNEFVRLLVMIRAHGVDEVAKVQAHRLSVVSGLILSGGSK